MTSPEKGYYGIAVVLDNGTHIELDRRKWSYPICHIAITPLIYDHIVTLDEIDRSSLKPLVFDRCFQLKGRPEFYGKETMIHMFLTANVLHLPVLGKIDPLIVYSGELFWTPQGDSFHLCGPIDTFFGREAYIAWLREQSTLFELNGEYPP